MEEQDWILEEIIDSLCHNKRIVPIQIIITEYEEEEDCD